MQPAGFQYVMRYSIHSADITGLCLATKLKLAAVADESGTVSVLDLMQVTGMPRFLCGLHATQPGIMSKLHFSARSIHAGFPSLWGPQDAFVLLVRCNTLLAFILRVLQSALAASEKCTCLQLCMQPTLLWTTRVLQRPIRHLAVGCHVMPSSDKKADKEKGSGSTAAAGAAAEQIASGEIERWAFILAEKRYPALRLP